MVSEVEKAASCAVNNMDFDCEPYDKTDTADIANSFFIKGAKWFLSKVIIEIAGEMIRDSYEEKEFLEKLESLFKDKGK